MKGSVLQFYITAKENFLEAEKNQANRIRLISIARLITFVLIPGFLFLFQDYGTVAQVIPSTLALIVFLVLVKQYIKAEKEKRKLSIQARLAADEIEALNHRFSVFPDGTEFQDLGHPYSFDLDIFGKGSLFQFLNRTSTAGGKKLLATWLSGPPLNPSVISERQAAVKELAQKREWRLEFLTRGKMFNESLTEHHEILDWSIKELPLAHQKFIGILIKVLPAIAILSLIAGIWFGLWQVFYVAVFSQWATMFLFRQKIKDYFGFFGQKSQLIEKYVTLLDQVVSEKFDSGLLQNLHSKITSPQSAGKIIGQLGRIVREFEYRQNILVGFFLNSLFLWDVRCVYLLWRWHSANRKKLAEWLETIETTDAIISLANLSDDHPEYVFPEIAATSFTLSTQNMGHPLLNPLKRVDNDFSVDGWSKTVIVTGANMAGKSTFLRAVGVNLILARTGAPVCASRFEYTPVGIFTNMRTTDSLFDDESYFFAELKRLKNMLTRLENGEQLFVIIDEMLKGTNSVDKLNGSKKLIQRLIQFKSVALIATHDLKLSEMEADFPQNITNKCFEIKIEGNELVFDFKLSDGVTRTMNASFLMKKMGLIGEDEE